MKIYAVTNHYLDSVRDLFKPHEVNVLPENYYGIIADLIVFSGGSDVEPSRYHSKRTSSWTEPWRDELELKVLSDITRGKLRTTRVLGICRGLQIMNVAFGGNLVFDIEERYGRNHPAVHDLNWHSNNMLSGILPSVNSMHHQCVSALGDLMPRNILATEPSTGSIEAVVWKDSYLGLQFHPEFFPAGELKSKVGKILCDWALEKVEIFGEKRYAKPSSRKAINFSTTFAAYTDAEE